MMLWFIARRTARAILTLLGVLTITFFLIRINGDPAALMLGPEATPRNIAAFNHAYGFDQSVVTQYVQYLSHVIRGRFGDSVRTATPALPLVMQELPSTLVLAFCGFGAGLLSALMLSVVVQLSRSPRLLTVLTTIGALAQSIPPFLLGIVLILVFAIKLRVLPALGQGGIRYLILPGATLGLYEMALFIRLFNAAFGEEATQDYVRTAFAKGQRRWRVLLRHMLPNGLLPILTVAGINLGNLIGGTVIVEAVFDRTGVGQLIYSSVTAHDYPVVQVGLIVFAVFFVLINLVIDLLYAVIDPRVRRA